MTDTVGTLAPVRFFGPLDVYHYTVDNRPLTDLKNRDDALALAVDAVLHAGNLGDVAAAYVARGYATQNMMVGKVSYPSSSVSIKVDRSFLNQETVVGAVTLPRLGLNTAGKTFTFTPPAAGLVLPVSIQAKVVDPTLTTDLPFLDESNTYASGAGQVGELDWLALSGTAVASNPVFPTVTAGYVEIFRVLVPAGVVALNSSFVTYRQFKEEGVAFGASGDNEYRYDFYRYTATGGETVISGVPVNCYYAFITIDGVFQQHDSDAIPGSVVIDSTSQVTFPEALPAGAVVDFTVTAGGKADIAQYGTKYWSYTATPGQTVFTGMGGLAASSVVFVNGVYQGKTSGSYTINEGTQTITFSEALESGDTVSILEFQVIASSIPAIPGGTTGQVLKKNSNADYDYSWDTNTAVADIPGGSTGEVLTKLSNADNDYGWAGGSTSHCQGKLVVVNSNNIALFPYNGNYIVINGSVRVIPPTGVVFNKTTDLTVTTNNEPYMVFASWDGANIVLTASPASTITLKLSGGIVVNNADVTKTLVGAFFVTTTAQFDAYNVRSYYNGDSDRITNTRGILTAGPFGNRAFTSTAGEIASGTMRRVDTVNPDINPVLAMPGDVIELAASARMGSSTTNNPGLFMVGLSKNEVTTPAILTMSAGLNDVEAFYESFTKITNAEDTMMTRVSTRHHVPCVPVTGTIPASSVCYRVKTSLYAGTRVTGYSALVYASNNFKLNNGSESITVWPGR